MVAAVVANDRGHCAHLYRLVGRFWSCLLAGKTFQQQHYNDNPAYRRAGARVKCQCISGIARGVVVHDRIPVGEPRCIEPHPVAQHTAFVGLDVF